MSRIRFRVNVFLTLIAAVQRSIHPPQHWPGDLSCPVICGGCKLISRRHGLTTNSELQLMHGGCKEGMLLDTSQMRSEKPLFDVLPYLSLIS
jgi:hypothetical protein